MDKITAWAIGWGAIMWTKHRLRNKGHKYGLNTTSYNLWDNK